MYDGSCVKATVVTNDLQNEAAGFTSNTNANSR